AAAGREAAQASTRGDHAMTRNHDGERVARQGLANLTGQPRVPQATGKLAVRGGFAGGNRARRLVDATFERIHAVHVQVDAREVAWITAQERRDTVKRLADSTHWRRPPGPWPTPSVARELAD